MFPKKHALLWLTILIPTLILSCKSQPDTLKENTKEITEVNDSLPIKKDPCSPPPPCLDPWERPITLLIQPLKGIGQDFKILASQNPNASTNYTITTKPSEGQNTFKVECSQPFRLAKGKNNSINLYIKKTADTFHTLTIKLREEEISCCPMLIPDEILFNRKVISTNCKRGQLIKLP